MNYLNNNSSLKYFVLRCFLFINLITLLILPLFLISTDVEKINNNHNQNNKLGKNSPLIFQSQKISTSNGTSFYIDESGSLYMWGLNNYGQLGIGNEINQNLPQKVLFNNLDNDETIVDAGTSDLTSYALSSKGKLYMWGSNKNGQLATGNQQKSNLPILIDVDQNRENEKILSIDTDEDTVHTILDDKSLWMWGDNKYGQIGNGNQINQLKPVKVIFPDGEEQISQVSSNDFSTYAISFKGKFYTWGINNLGQLGTGDTNNYNTPQIIDVDPNQENEIIRHADMEFDTSFAITAEGKLYVWGWNVYGQVGNNQLTNQLTPTYIDIDPNTNNEFVVNAIVDTHSSYALLSNGNIYIWGWNAYGQIGDGNIISSLTPKIVDVIPNQDDEIVVQSGLRDLTSFAVTENGELYTWGRFSNGQLGREGNFDFRLPGKVNFNLSIKMKKLFLQILTTILREQLQIIITYICEVATIMVN